MGKEDIIFQVMVPIYKVEPYLKECIQSVLNQTYGNFHLILLDDGSPDRCGEICDAYAAKDSRITAYHKPNGGLMQTRRFGLEKAPKEGYAIFLDGDDSLCPQALQVIAETIRDYSCDCVIYSAEKMRSGQSLGQLETLAEEPVLIRDKRELLNIVLNGSFYAVWRKAVRMDLFYGWEFSPYYHLSVGEDRLQSLQIYENAESFCFIPDALYHYRMNPCSITNTAKLTAFKVDVSILEAELTFLREMNVFTDEDFLRYRNTQIEQTTRNLIRISQLKTTSQNKRKFFEEIKDTHYWKTFLSKGSYPKEKNWKFAMIFDLFKKGAYGRLISIAEIYMGLSELLGRTE